MNCPLMRLIRLIRYSQGYRKEAGSVMGGTTKFFGRKAAPLPPV